MTFLMAMMAGLQGVRSAISSALTLYPVSPLGNRIRAGLDLGKLLVVGGIETLTTDFDRQRAMDVIMDDILRAFPSKEQCTSAVCRRILGIYGDVYSHDQLNDATHNAMHEMFGVANTRDVQPHQPDRPHRQRRRHGRQRHLHAAHGSAGHSDHVRARRQRTTCSCPRAA